MTDIEEKEFSEEDYAERLRELIEKRNEELLKTREAKKVIELFDPVFDDSKSFWDRLVAFLKAENKLGRDVGKLLDKYASEEINDAREFVKKHIIPKF